ncbi:MAG: histidine--tRNA ligase [Candidatus Taylorbacteria bacterium RIFCSPLOWO2_02_FULL_43_11]|uniref:Histidine--tRNA ligase n=1 Tax=Candidatus Taylorbacteria bacterium RIFCSPHIGHO2_02_FULL_43_32b TaxID=1802306 RepID=A0A1G2MEE4_9BACT|nr:MAG: histidine--tRNA ligase [Candidatus Taylorbacteria bacterium RIFCSPHIGHO2_01_FULL_43_47]OHA22258.1 MAG: histidine--tRNA ligase [Candidatus Taylorbacteria bacterium RIFCSPHIGHO2_02_FULL_43_32b]OHA29607.1 MAG: histidine--tRNA ligase [Candidatus Taylorbacteria bacterium RIFCSPLOWO2_01_FULL_43_44]OHA36143.1 MAG: histidine--tRNA ligase [Candidatus Taylorbacteria bacterium RIFCSPLOWO2_02_FULL_43_11]
MTDKGLSMEPYKGVRDFYPEDMAIFRYITDTMRQTAELFGYEEYGASVLEPSELYRGKSGDEIVNEQTYTFIDRGEREVTLRPEMTPTVSRMIAAMRRNLPMPIRWYSIPNLFRYEQPQRGRLREHWQLNCDLFGVNSVEGDAEVILLASSIMRAFGLTETDFVIRVNNRKIMNFIISDYLKLDDSIGKKISRIIDKKEKLPVAEFKKMVTSAIGEKDEILLTLLESKNFEEFVSHLPKNETLNIALQEMRTLIESLENKGVRNVQFDQTLMRGFDYYTGIVFEIFDTNPKNRRALFGGGRYDNLLSAFGVEPLSAVGFGMGDVTMRDVLETRGLLPKYKNPAYLAIIMAEQQCLPYASELTRKLRADNVAVSMDISGKKVGDQIKAADKKGIPFILVIGDDEVKSGNLKIKELATGVETVISDEKLSAFFKK